MSSRVRYQEDALTTVARITVFAVALASVLAAFPAYVEDLASLGGLAPALGLMLLGIAADAVVVWLGGARGQMLRSAVVANTVLWTALALVLALLATDIPGRSTEFPLLTVTLLLVLFCIGVAASVALPRTQAIVAWIIASALLASIAGQSTMLAAQPSPGAEQALLFAGGSILVAAALGALSFYIRRAIAARFGAPGLIGRLGLVAAAVVVSVALSTGATVLVGRLIVEYQVSETVMTRRAYLMRVSQEMSSTFAERDLGTPSPELARELAHYASLEHVGLTLYDLRADRVVVAVRLAPHPNGADDGPPAFQSVDLSNDEIAAIRAAVADGFSVLPDGPAVIGYMQPSWVPIGYKTGQTEPDYAVYSEEQTQTHYWSVPDSERFALVMTEAYPDWMDYPPIAADEVAAGYGLLVAPWLFAAFMLPCTLGLLALDRRDAANIKLAAAEERVRINRDAHDRVYNRLTALANRLASSEDTPATSHSASEEIRATIGQLQAILGDASAEPAPALTGAVASLLADVCTEQARTWSLEVSFGGADALEKVHPRIGWQLQCIVSEALSNAARHGGASKATVTAERSDDSLVLRIADDGTGITGGLGDDGLPLTGTGVRGIAARVAEMGGEFSIRSGESGTTLIVTVPSS